MTAKLKRILTVVFVALIAIASAPLLGSVGVDLGIKADAYLAAIGQCGENLYWDFDEDTGALTIDGTGAFYSSFSGFRGNKDIKSVHISSGITKIPDYMFRSCSNITQVTGGADVTEVGTSSFGVCSSLKSVSFLSNLTLIHDLAFESSALSGTIVFNNPVTIYGAAFAGNRIEKLVFRSDANLGNSAFLQSSVSEVVFPETDAEIKLSLLAFAYCSELEELYLPATVTSISIDDALVYGVEGEDFFTGLKTIRVSENSPYYTTDENGILYNKAKTKLLCSVSSNELVSVVLPETVEEIADIAFSHNKKLTSVTLGSNVRTIGESAFYKATSLKKIVIPDSVTSIGNEAFDYCSSLKTVLIGTSVKTFNNPFANCFALTAILVKNGNTVFSSDSYGVLYDYNKTQVLRYPASSTNDTYVMPSSVTTVNAAAFQNAVNLQNVTFSSNLKTLSYSAFSGCKSLKAADLSMMTSGSIASASFYDCSSLETVKLPSDLTVIESSLFSECEKLTAVTIPQSVTAINSFAFKGCKSLASVVIPNAVKTLDYSVFEECSSLKTVSIGSSVNNISYNTFAYCPAIEKITVSASNNYFCTDSYGVLYNKDKTILYCFPAASTYTSYSVPQGVTTLYYYAFCGSKNLKTLNISSTVEKINSSSTSSTYYVRYTNALVGAQGLEKIVVSSDNPYFSSDSYGVLFNKDKTKLVKYPEGNTSAEYTIPASVTEISTAAFYKCYKLEKINVAAGNTEFTSDENGVVFSKDKTVLMWYPAGNTRSEYVVPDGVVSYKQQAFLSINNLKKLTLPESVTSCSTVELTSVEDLYVMNPECQFTIWNYNNNPDFRIHSYAESTAQKFCEEKGITFVPYEHPHEYTITVTQKPGCTVDGTAVYSCDCGYSYEEPVSATGHSYGAYIVEKQATCTAAGSKYRICSACDDVDTATITKLGHSYSSSYTVDKQATCTATGSKSKHCTRSGCSSKTSETEIPATGHSYGSYTVTKAATCTAAGSKQRVCSVCKNTETVTITKLGHSYSSSYTVDKKATCTTVGSKSKHCTRSGCTAKTSVTQIPATGHTAGAAATCTTAQKCTVCSIVLKDKLGHSYTSKVTKAETCTKNGIRKYTCSRCAYSYNETIPAHHNYSDEDGLCKVCKANKFEDYFSYRIINKKADITDVDERIYGNVTVPSVLGGYPVTSISEFAFTDCTLLKKVIIPDSVTYLYPNAFLNCSLTAVVIPESITAMGDAVFYGCSSLKSVNIPDSVTFIGGEAFRYCSSLTSVVIPDSITKLNDAVFSGCTSLKSITIPDTVNFIGMSAFENCSSLTSVKIPSAVNCIEHSAFYGCSALKSIKIPDSVSYIASAAFHSCTGLTSVTLPKNVNTLASGVFADCTSLKTVVIKSDITHIPVAMFSGCTALTSVTMPDSITNIEAMAFYECTALNSITIPGKVTNIGEKAFYGCTSLASVVIPDKVTKIGTSAFRECKSLKTITIPNSVTTIDNYAFMDCSALTSVKLPNKLTKIRSSVFKNCTALKSVTVPKSVTSIGNSTFSGCKALKNVYYVGSQTQWKNITVGTDNAYLTKAAISYNYCKHTYSTVITKASTCAAAGSKKHTCTYCSYSYTEVIKALPHTYKAVTTKATLTANGKIENKCSVCSYVSKTTVIYYPKTISLSATSVTYNGNVRTPGVTVKTSGGKVLTKGTDYTVTYASGRKNAGTYKVTVTMKGNYTGTKTLTFKINPINISKCTVSLSATSYTYDGKVKAPTVTVKNSNGVKLTNGTHYSVSYASGRKNVGTYKVTIKMLGNYTGSKTLTFKINPPATTVASLTSGTKSITVNLNKKTTQVTGYQIQYSTNKDFTNAKTKTITSNSTVKTTLSSLTSGKTYYVRVRTYKTVNDVKYYSAWSQYKYVKTK